MSLASVASLFAGATVSGGNVTLPSGTIVSFVPTSLTDPGGYELVFGLCESLHQKVGTNYDNMNSFVQSQLINNGTTLRRSYTFNIDLLLGSNDVASLNVRPTGSL